MIVLYLVGEVLKKVICFSFYFDDDVISMGGMLIWFVEDGYEVYVVYMMSGNIVVFDYDVLCVVDLVIEYN